MSSTALAIANDKLPAHLAKVEGIGRGNENVGSNVAIPRVKLLQKMSDEVDKGHSKYVGGAEAGHFLNTLTDYNYGDTMYALSITFKAEYVVWRSRDAGGGYVGAYDTLPEARDAIAALDRPDDYDWVETHSHLLLLKDPKTGALEPSPVIMDFSSSKLRISKNWNAQLGMKGGDRFAGLWKLESKSVENRVGNSFMNLDVEFVGGAHEEAYLAAEALYTLHA